MRPSWKRNGKKYVQNSKTVLTTEPKHVPIQWDNHNKLGYNSGLMQFTSEIKKKKKKKEVIITQTFVCPFHIFYCKPKVTHLDCERGGVQGAMGTLFFFFFF